MFSSLSEFLIIAGLGLIGGWAISHPSDTKTEQKQESTKVEVNLNPIDLWELKKLGK